MAKANTVKPAMAKGNCLVVATIMRHVRLFSNSHDMLLAMPLPLPLPLWPLIRSGLRTAGCLPQPPAAGSWLR